MVSSSYIVSNFLDRKPNETCLQLFMPKINGHEFNYSAMKDSLLEVLIDFALIRATIQK